MIDFTELRAQIEDGLILEDELELAKLAVLVPDLVRSMEVIVQANRDAEAVLLNALDVLSKIQEGFPELGDTSKNSPSEMRPIGEQGEVQPKLSVKDG